MSTRRAFLSTTGLGLVAPSLLRAQAGSGPDQAAAPPGLPKLQAVPYRSVQVADSFWAPRQATNRAATVPHLFAELREKGYVSNFERAAKGLEGGYKGPVYMDSDVYKSLEAAAYVLGQGPEPKIQAEVDFWVDLVRSAQQADGYVNTFHQVNRRPRFSNLQDNHEIYCAGHLIEAGVAPFEATGQRPLLDIAIRYADLLARTFGEGAGQRAGYPGHPEAELALFRLVAGHRGTSLLRSRALLPRAPRRGLLRQGAGVRAGHDFDGTYYLDHVKIRDHKIITGHAVRALYLLSGAADLARETDDPGLVAMMDRVWSNATLKRLFITGGFGSSSLNEGFTNDYDLPNLSAYQESCASLAAAMWAERLALLHADTRYADLVEQAFYNAVAAGVSLEGTQFFYANPLASDGAQHRRPWYGTACCPPNLARVIATVGGYAYATSERDLYVNLFLQGQVATTVAGGPARVEVTTDYPWDGRVALRVAEAPASGFGLRLRAPAWCTGPIALSVNGTPLSAPRRERGYLVLARPLHAGDHVVLDLPMPVRRVEADPRVEEAAGRVALQRGPLVYCAEQVDQDRPLALLALPQSAAVRPDARPTCSAGWCASWPTPWPSARASRRAALPRVRRPATLPPRHPHRRALRHVGQPCRRAHEGLGEDGLKEASGPGERPDATKASAWLDRFFASYYDRRPVNATFIGVHDRDHLLPDFGESAVGDTLAEMEGLLRDSEDLDLEPCARPRAPRRAPGPRLPAHAALRVSIGALPSRQPEHLHGRGRVRGDGALPHRVRAALRARGGGRGAHGGDPRLSAASARQRQAGAPGLDGESDSRMHGCPGLLHGGRGSSGRGEGDHASRLQSGVAACRPGLRFVSRSSRSGPAPANVRALRGR